MVWQAERPREVGRLLRKVNPQLQIVGREVEDKIRHLKVRNRTYALPDPINLRHRDLDTNDESMSIWS